MFKNKKTNYIILKNIILSICKFSTNTMLTIYLTKKLNEIFTEYETNIFMKIIIPIASFITVETITDCMLYLIEKAYLQDQITLCKAADLIKLVQDINDEMPIEEEE